MSNKVRENLERQLEEDREMFLESFKDLKGKILTAQDYAVNGVTLTKLGDLLVKQTSQLIELAKIEKKKNPDEEGLSAEDLEVLSNEVEKVKVWK